MVQNAEKYKVVSKPLTDANYNKPRVDIIIPYHGCYGSVTSLVESLLRTTKYPFYKITLVDDFSLNESYSTTIKGYTNLDFIRTKEHVGFGAAVNLGIKSTNQDLICIVHSDVTIVEGNWLHVMVDNYLKLRSNGLGFITVPTDFSGINSDVLDCKKTHNDNVVLFDQHYFPLYCSLIPRETLNRVGLFKEYKYAWFEDQEMFCRLSHYGYKNYVVRDSWVKHKGYTTIKPLIESNRKVVGVIKENKELYNFDISKYNLKKIS